MGLEKFGVRTAVSLVFGPLILLAAWRGGYLFLAVILSIVFLAMGEFYDIAAQKVTNPQRGLGIVMGLALCLTMYFSQMQHVWLVLSGGVLLLLLYELFRNAVGPILNVATTLMGVFYVAFTLGFLLLVRELPGQVGVGYNVGGLVVILIFLAIWICDSAAYILGSRLGRHKLFERVSPNKTVEGTAFGFLFALLTAYVCQKTFLAELPLVHALAIGGICGSVGQLSDLVESLFKRDARVKDASQLIPGHGGILDRFDSEILTAPVVYLYLVFVAF